MATQKKIISMAVVLGAMVCCYLYASIFSSAIRFENNKALFNQSYFSDSKNESVLLSQVPSSSDSWLQKVILHNPAETELYLRSALLDYQELSSKNISELIEMYNLLIKIRPTWAYYFSGKAQLAMVAMVDQPFDGEQLKAAVKYGKHERKVVESLAEVLFYNWNKLQKKEKNELLTYLSDQTDSSIARVVNISAKFARIYEYCDFLYDKKRVEYAACKNQYWQPLSDIQ
ncbi:MAG: hypothetical protein L3J83_08065 [Proteobacteria bacterium]|nr:hypothetical protein [Pseudomonadota bacterium]